MITRTRASGSLFSFRMVLILFIVTAGTGGFILGYAVGSHLSPAPASSVGTQVQNDPAAQALSPLPNLTMKSDPLPSGDGASQGIQKKGVQEGVSTISHDLSSQPNTVNETKKAVPSEKAVQSNSISPKNIKTASEPLAKASLGQEASKRVSSETGDSSHKKVIYTVQAGAFKSRKDAEKIKVKLEQYNYNISIKKEIISKDNLLFKVRVGEFERKTEAEVFALKIKNADGLNAFVTVKN